MVSRNLRGANPNNNKGSAVSHTPWEGLAALPLFIGGLNGWVLEEAGMETGLTLTEAVRRLCDDGSEDSCIRRSSWLRTAGSRYLSSGTSLRYCDNGELYMPISLDFIADDWEYHPAKVDPVPDLTFGEAVDMLAEKGGRIRSENWVEVGYYLNAAGTLRFGLPGGGSHCPTLVIAEHVLRSKYTWHPPE